jgi:hypothetical protein
MKLTSFKNSIGWKWIVATLLFGVLHSCQRTDPLAELSPESQSSLLKASPESADFVYQWYKALAEIQLPNPAGSPPINFRHFAYIGVGLFESVQPGIKGGSSLSPKLYQMPAMPKPDMSKDYLWSASANAALASMFKLFLTGPTGLTPANISRINAIEAANYNRFRSLASEEVLQRSQAFGRAIALAIYNWSTTDNFTMASNGYVPPVFPGAWVPTSNPPTIAGAYLGNSRPFLKYTLKALAPPIAIPYSTARNSQFYLAAKEVYEIGLRQER